MCAGCRVSVTPPQSFGNHRDGEPAGDAGFLSPPAAPKAEGIALRADGALMTSSSQSGDGHRVGVPGIVTSSSQSGDGRRVGVPGIVTSASQSGDRHRVGVLGFVTLSSQSGDGPESAPSAVMLLCAMGAGPADLGASKAPLPSTRRPFCPRQTLWSPGVDLGLRVPGTHCVPEGWSPTQAHPWP